MEKLIKVFLLVFIILYIVSPIDAAPGPIDDVILTLLGMVAKRKMVAKKEDVIEQ